MSNIELQNITHSFTNSSGGELIILDNISLVIKEKEILVLLGRSGSGKSTLLRIIAGLIKPTKGKIIKNNEEIDPSNEDVAMIFQNFALFPWLTVWQNIEIALKPKNLSNIEINDRINKVLDVIGLNGYESAYPRELSGGMRQRVGFARALATNPKMLLMDEPFSALDILTSHTLRTDFLDLWNDQSISINNAIIVTHNIEEAVFFADRIQIFSSNPGRIIQEIIIDIEHPRDRLDPKFKRLVEDIYLSMTSNLNTKSEIIENNLKLPKISFNFLKSFVESFAAEPHKGKASLSILTSEFKLEVSKILTVIENLQLLRFVSIKNDQIHLTSAGKIYAEGDIILKRKILAEHIVQYVPYLASIRRSIDEAGGKQVSKKLFEEELKSKLPIEEIDQVFKSIISWGREAELFNYNDNLEVFYRM